jgi:hypothetical protein
MEADRSLKMNVYNSLFSDNAALNEQIARQVFEVVDEGGPLVIIIDGEGNCWPSNSEKFERLNLDKGWIENFCSKICDGVEPVISHVDNNGIVGSGLIAEHSKCGYIIMVMEGQSPESMLCKLDLVEMILIQFNLIAKLIEKYNILYQTQAKLYSKGYIN